MKKNGFSKIFFSVLKIVCGPILGVMRPQGVLYDSVSQFLTIFNFFFKIKKIRFFSIFLKKKAFFRGVKKKILFFIFLEKSVSKLYTGLGNICGHVWGMFGHLQKKFFLSKIFQYFDIKKIFFFFWSKFFFFVQKKAFFWPFFAIFWPFFKNFRKKNF